jgi:hypothetical protein
MMLQSHESDGGANCGTNQKLSATLDSNRNQQTTWSTFQEKRGELL